ncbi:MAG TPA: hypothetical protein PKD45_15040 [Flavobacteriales bacterium]|nr:hypothetical protein [Flavobacteriales bacterium]
MSGASSRWVLYGAIVFIVWGQACSPPNTVHVDQAFEQIDSNNEQEVLSRIAQLPPRQIATDPDIYYIIGYIHEKEGMLDSAIWYYRRAIDLGGYRKEIMFAQARVFYEQGEFEWAFHVLSIIERRDSCYRQVRYYQALALSAMGREQEAASRCASQLRCDPNDTLALSKLANLEFSLGRYDDALGTTRFMYEISPTSPHAQLLARSLANTGANERALQILDTAFATYGKSAGLFSTRAAIYGDMGRTIELRADLISALSMDSMNVAARMLLQVAFDNGEIHPGDTLYHFVQHSR